MIIADTSVWSLLLRRNSPGDARKVQLLRAAIQNNQVEMLGTIRQELLSGVSDPAQFDRLSAALTGFPDLLATSSDHALAAQFFTVCRKAGVQGSHIDFLICAQSYRHRLQIITTDGDFLHYARHIPIPLG